MRHLFFLSCLVTMSLSALCQSKVKLADLKQYFGDSVIVEGRVKTIKYLQNEEHAPTIITIGTAKNVLTIIIWQTVRNKFSVNPEQAFSGKSIRVTGKLSKEKGEPCIFLADPVQIVTLDKK